MQLMPQLTTATEVQRNFKKVSKRAKSINDPLIVLSNNKPDLIVADYRWYVHVMKLLTQPQRKKMGVDAIVGIWTKKEADEFDKNIEEAFEKIHPDDWK